MSQANVEIVERGIDAFNQRNRLFLQAANGLRTRDLKLGKCTTRR